MGVRLLSGAPIFPRKSIPYEPPAKYRDHLGRRRPCRGARRLDFYMGPAHLELMIRNLCAKCRKPFLFCLCAAVSVVGYSKIDPHVKPLPAHAVEATMATAGGPTGAAGQNVAYDQVTGRRIVATWPDQRGQAIFGPTAATAPFSTSAGFGPTGPTGCGGPPPAVPAPPAPRG